MEKTVIYYWYDHMIRLYKEGSELIRQVEDSIRNKDFKKFMELRETMNNMKDDNGRTYEFLPSHASVFEGDDFIEDLDITIEENFNKIDEEEYECG